VVNLSAAGSGKKHTGGHFHAQDADAIPLAACSLQTAFNALARILLPLFGRLRRRAHCGLERYAEFERR
jgi:hypothetical protein